MALRKVGMTGTFTTSAPDEKIEPDFVVVGSNNVIRYHNEERVARVNGEPVYFKSVNEATAYATKHK